MDLIDMSVGNTSARGAWLRQKNAKRFIVVALVVSKKRVSPESL